MRTRRDDGPRCVMLEDTNPKANRRTSVSPATKDGLRPGPRGLHPSSPMLLLLRPGDAGPGHSESPWASPQQGSGCPEQDGGQGAAGRGDARAVAPAWAPLHAGMRRVPESPACRWSLYTRYSKHQGRNKQRLISSWRTAVDNLLFLEQDSGLGRVHGSQELKQLKNVPRGGASSAPTEAGARGRSR